MLAISKAISKATGKSVARGNRVGMLTPQPDLTNLLAWYKGTIADSLLVAFKPETNHTTQQVKSSGFLAAGSATVTGLLTTDTITASGPSTLTCSVNGTLTFPEPDCWDIDVFREGVLWASWKGINVGKDAELDASGNGHHLIGIVGTTITERLDGSGTNYANEAGFTVADGTQYFDSNGETLITTGWRIPVLLDGSGSAAWSWVFEPLTIDGAILTIDGATLNIGV